MATKTVPPADAGSCPQDGDTERLKALASNVAAQRDKLFDIMALCATLRGFADAMREGVLNCGEDQLVYIGRSVGMISGIAEGVADELELVDMRLRRAEVSHG